MMELLKEHKVTCFSGDGPHFFFISYSYLMVYIALCLGTVKICVEE